MKVYVLNTGYVFGNQSVVVKPETQEEIDGDHRIKLPVMAMLIEHETAGWILYDLGCHPDAMKGYWPKNLKETFPVHMDEENYLENQLALCGVKPEDIGTVVVSHMHLDHAGNLHLFKHADVYVPKKDFEYGLALVHSCTDPEKHGAYIKADMDVPVRQFHLVEPEQDFELAHGIEVVNLPGHTPGLLGLVIHLEKEGTLIFPQDCLYTAKNYGPPARPSNLVYDEKAFFHSIEKVRALSQKYDAKVMFAHDEAFFETVKKAPAYYE